MKPIYILILVFVFSALSLTLGLWVAGYFRSPLTQVQMDNIKIGQELGYHYAVIQPLTGKMNGVPFINNDVFFTDDLSGAQQRAEQDNASFIIDLYNPNNRIFVSK